MKKVFAVLLILVLMGLVACMPPAADQPAGTEAVAEEVNEDLDDVYPV